MVIQLNFAYWVLADLTAHGLTLARKVAILRAVRSVWNDAFPQIQLVGSDELDALARQVGGVE